MEKRFPQLTKSQQNGLSGESYIEYFVINELKWIFHQNSQGSDFGIDAYIEVVENENVTGKLLALQIKHGNSYFKYKKQNAYKYIGDKKHLNYYLNNGLPLIIIIADDKFKRIHWVKFDISLTEGIKDGWSIDIPMTNILDKKVKYIWKEFTGPIIDYQDEINLNWKINKVIQNHDSLFITINRNDILNRNYEYLLNMLKRISNTYDLLLAYHSSIEIFFPEYDDDPREIIEIPEIMDWFRNSFNIVPWAYYLDYSSTSYTFLFLFHSFVENNEYLGMRNNKASYMYKSKDIIRFMKLIFNNLNDFTDKNNIPIIINKEISEGITKFFEERIVFQK
jgi:hypothetical protein